MNTDNQRSNLETVTAWFIFSVVLILSATALAKLVSSFGTARILDIPDALLNISNRQLLILAVVLEALAVGFLSLGRNSTWKLGAIAWLTLVFGAYRFGILLAGGPGSCPCLGTLTDNLHVSPVLVEKSMLGTLFYMGVGSLALLALSYFKRDLKPALTT